MMRSDDLYREMNYVIEILSSYLVESLIQCKSLALQSSSNLTNIKTLYNVMNSILHIIQSILG